MWLVVESRTKIRVQQMSIRCIQLQLYLRLIREQPDFVKKIVMIEGDTGQPDLGLSSEDRDRLLDTDIIFHGAATVRFDETIRTATNINIKGTKELISFAKQMPNLKVRLKRKHNFQYQIIHLSNFLGIRAHIDRLLVLSDQIHRRKIIPSPHNNRKIANVIGHP